MKIIKPGRDCEIYGTCENCKCEFLYDKDDVEVDDTDEIFVTCPWCGAKIYVKYRLF